MYEDINRYKTDEYAALLITAVRTALEHGFNPFELAKETFVDFKEQTPQQQEKKVWTCTEAFNYFVQEWEQRGLEEATLTRLKRAIEVLVGYLTKHNLHHAPVKSITRDHVKAALREANDANEWSNRTFNKNRTALATLFIFLEKEKIIDDIPTEGIEKKKTKSKKHRYYDSEQFERVCKVMKQDDPLVYFATKLIYYLCIRAEKELKHFHVGNIFLDRKQVLIQAEKAKTDADRFIPIPDELIEKFSYISKPYPPEYYVIGKGNRIKFVRENTPSAKPFPNNMIPARFAKIRKKAKVTSDHTPYGFKHTRVIHLKQDGRRMPILCRLPDTPLIRLMPNICATWVSMATRRRSTKLRGNFSLTSMAGFIYVSIAKKSEANVSFS